MKAYAICLWLNRDREPTGIAREALAGKEEGADQGAIAAQEADPARAKGPGRPEGAGLAGWRRAIRWRQAAAGE